MEEAPACQLHAWVLGGFCPPSGAEIPVVTKPALGLTLPPSPIVPAGGTGISGLGPQTL